MGLLSGRHFIIITFIPLTPFHFPYLLKWLETPHVKAWWECDVTWTANLIHEKYTSYTQEYKLEKGAPKKISAYVICINDVPVGYSQLYNAYDFARSEPLVGLPSRLAAFDIFIGEACYVKQGLGTKVITEFLRDHSQRVYFCFF